MDEANFVQTEHGLKPEGEGWYVMNAAEAEWGEHETFGRFCGFEGAARFQQYGINIHVIEPGRPSCMYHRENQQENFLVLAGECTLLIEEQARPLKQWDFVHCPPGTNHVFVGAGSEPCAILMVGGRIEPVDVTYPASELARQHDAGVATETSSAQEAYAAYPDSSPIASPWPLSTVRA